MMRLIFLTATLIFFSGLCQTSFGEKISQSEFQQYYVMQRNRMRQMLGAQYDPSVFDARIKEQALQDLIDQELLAQNAESNGFRVSMNSVKQTILNIDAFKQDGKFSNELYVRALQSQGESPSGFEHRLQKAVLTQLQRGVELLRLGQLALQFHQVGGQFLRFDPLPRPLIQAPFEG